ncbi:MAG: GH32 C-terminal domain-containing protein [Ginsengibacter sp.]
MPFTQMMLFPTQFVLKTTNEGIKLMATPIKEIDIRHSTSQKYSDLTAERANEQLNKIKPGPLHVKVKFTLAEGNKFCLRYQGNEILNLLPADVHSGENEMEILIDKTVAELFLNNGDRYIIRQLLPGSNNKSLELDSENYGPFLKSMEVYEMKFMWDNN